MAKWHELLTPATEADLKRTQPRGGKSIGTKFAEAAEKQIAELEKPAAERGKRLWWFTNSEGQLILRPRHGSNYVPFGGNTNGFVVKSNNEKDIASILTDMASDAREGALDTELSAAASKAAARTATKSTGRGRKAK